MRQLFVPIVLAVEEGSTEPTSGPEVFGVGSLVLILAVVAVLAWMAYLYVNSRRSRKAAVEETPQNLQPFISDDELENRRTTRVLRAALVGAGLLAIVLPWYAFNEPDRAADAAEAQAELDVEQGGEWYTNFFCVNCHGASLGGGAAAYTEERSGVPTSWGVPSLDDVLFRYSPDEVRHWIVFGRAGTPMPANGLEGGGAMSVQEIEQVLAYITANQLSQSDALAKTDTSVTLALNRMAAGDARAAELIAIQEAEIAEVEAAAGKMEVVGDMPDAIKDLLSAEGTCTAQSAAIVATTCGQPGADADRDGLSDEAEEQLTGYAALALETLPVLQADGTHVDNPAYAVSFDPTLPFTNVAADGTALADLDAATTFLETLDAEVLLLGVTAEREEEFLAGLVDGLQFLERSAELRLWDVDIAEVQRAMNERQGIDWARAVAETPEGEQPPDRFLVGGDQAERAVGLFNAYCARCHSGGYSAGSPFETGHGTGAWGPSLLSGRAVIQFPNWLDHVDFVIQGTQNAIRYGINGLGTGRMPSFGQILTEEDIQLIVMYERTL